MTGLTFQLFFTVGIGALVFVLAISYLVEVFAEFGLVLGPYLVLGVFELASVTFPAVVLQEIPTYAFPL